MRTHGTLSRWNEARGFGFVVPVEDKGEVFVHISAFPRDGKRPMVGEVISFDVQVGEDGKRRGLNITRPGGRTPPSVRKQANSNARKAPMTWIAVVAVGAAVAYGYTHLSLPDAVRSDEAPPQPLQQPAASSNEFACDGRTHCSQMTSCAEATYFLRHCPNTKMDGNGDGEPCEQQWCN